MIFKKGTLLDAVPQGAGANWTPSINEVENKSIFTREGRTEAAKEGVSEGGREGGRKSRLKLRPAPRN